MTTNVDVLYRYEGRPSESAMAALAKVREVYGIRRIGVNEEEKTMRVEFDATRLHRESIQKLLRRAGISIVEEVSLLPPQPRSEPLPAPPAAAPTK
jgi:hypothetical protein